MTLAPCDATRRTTREERLDIALGQERRGLVEHQNAAAASRISPISSTARTIASNARSTGCRLATAASMRISTPYR